MWNLRKNASTAGDRNRDVDKQAVHSNHKAIRHHWRIMRIRRMRRDRGGGGVKECEGKGGEKIRGKEEKKIGSIKILKTGRGRRRQREWWGVDEREGRLRNIYPADHSGNLRAVQEKKCRIYHSDSLLTWFLFCICQIIEIQVIYWYFKTSYNKLTVQGLHLYK